MPLLGWACPSLGRTEGYAELAWVHLAETRALCLPWPPTSSPPPSLPNVSLGVEQGKCYEMKVPQIRCHCSWKVQEKVHLSSRVSSGTTSEWRETHCQHLMCIFQKHSPYVSFFLPTPFITALIGNRQFCVLLLLFFFFFLLTMISDLSWLWHNFKP